MAKKHEKVKSDELVVRARRLRQRQTEAEKLLWYHLRNKRLGGYKFRRQHPIGGYIVDFFCDAAHLVVELDGGGHNEPGQIDYDHIRTSKLEERGLHVLRFWNDDVLTDTNQVLDSADDVMTFAHGLRVFHRLLEGLLGWHAVIDQADGEIGAEVDADRFVIDDGAIACDHP